VALSCRSRSRYVKLYPMVPVKRGVNAYPNVVWKLYVSESIPVPFPGNRVAVYPAPTVTELRGVICQVIAGVKVLLHDSCRPVGPCAVTLALRSYAYVSEILNVSCGVARKRPVPTKA